MQGWYPDPGGRSGWFRYWNGSSWSAELTTNPADPPPGTISASGLGSQPPAFAPSAPKRAGGASATVLAIVGIVLLALLAFFAIRMVTGGGGLNPFQKASDSFPTQDVCPKPPLDNTPDPHPQDGRVHGGKISFPMQGEPWSAPQFDDRVPFGVDVREQVVNVEPNYDGGQHSWVASLLVGDLVAGDGFYAPAKGVEVIAHCVLGTFYGNAVVHREDKVSQPITIDGHEGHLLEMHLSFDIPRLKTKGETAIIIVVSTGPSSAALYYASIPDTTPELLPVARSIVNQLTIDR